MSNVPFPPPSAPDVRLRETIKHTIESEDVVLFMKGTPGRAFCGNSARALEALRAAGAPIAAVDVLPDPRIRQELSAVSSWPTIPQVFIRGEFIGGADIVQELAATGELKEKLDSTLGRERAEPSERVIEIGESPFRLAR